MKRIKKQMAMALTIVMILMTAVGSSDVFTAKVQAATAFVITSPADGKLTGAGYMDIQWTSASDYGTVKQYDVYVDGTWLGSTGSLSYEYYTTQVYYHTAFVVATFSDGSQISTPDIRFGVTKKGLAISSGMGASRIAPYELNAGWYYNWGVNGFSYTGYDEVGYVPMIWNANNFNSDLEKAKAVSSKYILGFNEPDFSNQANMTVDLAVSLWPQVLNTGKKIGSPATGTWPKINTSWFQPFMEQISDNVDFICIHCYPLDYPGGKGMADWFLEEVVDWTWQNYHKPIWITEFSTEGNYITESNTSSFIRYLLPELDKREYVERYSFFSFNRSNFNGGLWYYTTGALSTVGETYRDYGNPTADAPQGSEKNTYAHSKDSSVTPTPTPQKPAKAKISSLKNVKGKKIKVTLKKISGAKGYQLKYADNKKLDGYESKNITKTTATFKGFSKKTRYYFTARAYVKNGSSKLYGAWSAKKSVKVSK